MHPLRKIKITFQCTKAIYDILHCRAKELQPCCCKSKCANWELIIHVAAPSGALLITYIELNLTDSSTSQVSCCHATADTKSPCICLLSPNPLERKEMKRCELHQH